EWLEMQDRNFTGQPISAALEHSPMDRDTWKTLGTNLMKSEHFRQEIVVRKRTYQVDAAHIPLGGRWVLTLSNITDLAELSQLKTRMIRIASHDLKNPLGRILGYAELMQEMVDDEEDDLTQYNYYLSRMIHSGEDMNKIITEILDLEHLRSGNIEREPLDMINTIRDVLDRSRFDAEQKKQTLTEQLPEHLPEIMGDFTQLVQGLSNLVGNAIKYTPEGGQIDVRLYQHGDAIRFEVQDNGYGIPKEAQGRLFSEFYRVHTDNTRDIKGTGLGLSLVKAVIEAHEGRVWVDSEYNEGSTFFVELPLAPVEV
ncbi:MAG: HAMP domain-containing sensor histidine kinase, partial [Chloroflexota bacterium]